MQGLDVRVVKLRERDQVKHKGESSEGADTGSGDDKNPTLSDGDGEMSDEDHVKDDSLSLEDDESCTLSSSEEQYSEEQDLSSDETTS